MLKDKLFKFMTSEQSLDWAKHLQDFVHNLNTMPRSPLFDYTPLQIEENTVLQGVIAVDNMKKSIPKPIKAPFTVGQFVRVPIMHKFKRGFKLQQSDRTYQIMRVFPSGIEVDVDGQIRRYLFGEVNEAGVPLDKDIFEVEEVLNQSQTIKRGWRNVKQHMVKFKGYDEPQWVDEADIKA